MIHYPKLIQIILNLTEIEALPKYIRNKSSEIQNLFSAEISSQYPKLLTQKKCRI